MSIYLGNLELATGGGATGTGLPVNSYAPFKVFATGSPTGYNSSTGLYEHPNGDVWLKTGNTMAVTSTTYPDATRAGVVSYTFLDSATMSASTGYGFTRTSNNWVRTQDGSAGTGVYTIDGTTGNWGVATGTTYDVGAANGESMASNGTTVVQNRLTNTYDIIEYDLTGTATGFSFSTTGQGGSVTIWGVAYHDNKYYVGKANTVYEYNATTGVYTGFSFVTSASSKELFFDGTLFYVITGSYLGQITTYSATGTSYGALSLGINAYDLEIHGENLYALATSNICNRYSINQSVGDGTARTDTDSGQPLFIKLK